MTDTAETLPGMGIPTPPIGSVEVETQRQIDALRRAGYIEEHHAGQVALALFTARAVDRSAGHGAPSGQANLIRALREIFELLPSPEAASQDALDKALEALRDNDDAEV